MRKLGKVQLKKALGFWTLYAIGVGAVIGDGIFTFAGYGISTAGPSVLWVFLMVGLCQMSLMISFGELVIWKPTSGGPEVWVRELVGKGWGGVSSVTFSLGWIIAGGTTSLAIGAYTHNFLLLIDINLEPTMLWVTILGIFWITFFAFLNIKGVDIAAKTQLFLICFLAFVIVLYILSTVPFVKEKNFHPWMPNGISGVFMSFPGAVYAYAGMSTVLFASEEAKKPVNVARALFWGSISLIALFCFSIFVIIGTLGYSDIYRFSESVFVTSCVRTHDFVFASIISFAAWLAAATCLLMGTLYQPSRDFYHLSREGYKVPSWFGELDPRFKTPSRGIIGVWSICVLLMIIGGFTGVAEFYELLAYQMVWFWSISSALTLWAAFRFRLRHKQDVSTLSWHVPFWPLTPILGVVGLILTIVGIFLDLFYKNGLLVAILALFLGLTEICCIWYIMRKIEPE